MAEKEDIMPVMYFKHRGIFDHSKLIKGIQDWFVENNYEFHAPKYKVKADEAEYDIECERKITEYVMYKIGLHMWIRDLKDIDVVQDGEKKKMNEGYIQLDVSGKIVFDWSKRFGGTKFVQWLHDIYQKYVIRQTVKDVYEDDLILKQQELISRIKALLGTEVS
jgi:hypothetical protein